MCIPLKYSIETRWLVTSAITIEKYNLVLLYNSLSLLKISNYIKCQKYFFFISLIRSCIMKQDVIIYNCS